MSGSAYTFKIGTKLTIELDDKLYEFVVRSASASQTFLEEERSVSTIHQRQTTTESFSVQKSPVNLNFEIYLSRTGTVESSVFSWFGFSKTNGKHIIRTTDNAAKQATIYIQPGGGTMYRLKGCVGENISFTMSHKELLGISVTATGEDMDIVNSIPSHPLVSQDILKGFYRSYPAITNYERNLASVSLELTRSIQWTKPRTTHDIGTIFTVGDPIIDSLAIAGSINQYRVSEDLPEYTSNETINIKYGVFEVNLQACSTMQRWDTGSDLHMMITDFKLLPSNNEQTYIKF